MIQKLKFGRNAVEDVTEWETVLTCMRSLRDFSYIGNPFELKGKARDYVLMMGLNIEELNGKKIMSHERDFLFKFHKLRK